jgi:hypothetical protein
MLLRCLLATAFLLSSVSADAAAPIVLENDLLRAEFSAKDGSITRLTNKRRRMELISHPPDSGKPWALLLFPFALTSEFTDFHISPAKNDGRQQIVKLEWQTPYRITVKAEARLAAGSDELELRCSADNAGDRTILALRYPAIQGIGMLSKNGAADRLLHSTMMGALFFDPFHLFRGDSSDPHARGMVVSRYPNGFHGSALQLMAYYAEGRGGFSIAAKDSHASDKDLNFFKADDNSSLICEIAHIQWDARPGKSLVVDYPVVVAALQQGTWQEAAERYRTWATQQPWCQRGTLRQRVDRGDACRWLLQEIGAVGMWWPFRGDIREDVARTRRLFGAPLLHLELWWRNRPSLDAAQSEGDRFGPFYFPFLALKGKKTFDAHRGDQIFPPARPIASDWVALCPAQPAWRNVVCESAEDMAGRQPLRHHQIWVDENLAGCNADCLYYDIGPCAGVPTHCYAANHAHTPGAGRDITQAYISLFDESRRRASRVKGAYVPVGTECISEPFVGCIDLYYARNAGLSLDMETSPYVKRLTWLPDGRMEIVPLFPFVYHEYGPIAVQGIYSVYPWNAPQGEDFFTWAEARTALWGGLIVTFPLGPHAAPSDSRTRFLRSLAAARTNFARDFLAYGRMQTPPAIGCGTIDIDHGLADGGWLRKIRYAKASPDLSAIGWPSEEPIRDQRRGGELSVEQWASAMLAVPATPAHNRTLKVPAVACQAYTLPDNRLGILLISLRPDSHESVSLPINPASYGLPAGSYELRQTDAAGQRSLGVISGSGEIELKLPPRTVVLVEAIGSHHDKVSMSQDGMHWSKIQP